MSMRYADISSPTELNIPAMPTLPEGLGGPRREGREQDEVVKDYRDLPHQRDGERAATEDKKMLDDKDFDPDTCMPIISRTSDKL